jgi:carbamate kinase
MVRAGRAASVPEQRAALASMLGLVAGLAAEGRPLVLTHGNGPQVGHILARAEAAGGRAYDIPLDVCVAQSQGEIGYLVAEALGGALRRASVERSVACVLTRVVVDPADPAFAAPSKPIGGAGPGSGGRRVVSSPRPREILEASAIRHLVDAGVVVVAAGGGGIPVRRQPDGSVIGVEGVVDKDYTSSLLALALGVPRILDITAVEHVKLHFGTPRERDLTSLTASEARRLLAEGHFPSGTMGPKIEAAVSFLEGGGRLVDVATPERAREALEGRAGTRIRRDA